MASDWDVWGIVSFDSPPGKTVGRRRRECGGGGLPPAREAGGRLRNLDCIKEGATIYQHFADMYR